MQNVLIFGATSAIAAEVAVSYARAGARLHLVGRNADKLAEVARRCEVESIQPLAPRVTIQVADFGEVSTNAQAVATAISTLGAVDIALIAHGDLGCQLASEQSFIEAETTLRVNFTSVVALLIPLANYMEQTRSGRIGVMTSVAGDRGRPRNYTYGTAKGALHIYLQGLRTRLYPAGVSVTTLKLGPVDTPMTRDHAKHMLFGKPAAVAASVVKALESRATEVYVPSIWGVIMMVVKHTPEAVIQRLPFLSGR